MALGDPYATDEELADRLGITTPSASETTRLEGAVATATEEIEKYCARTFWKTASTEERKFDISSRLVCLTDDFYTEPTAVKTVEYWAGGTTVTTVLVSTDWASGPRTYDLTLRPRWTIRNHSDVSWPVGPNAGYLLVTAQWGWPAVPGAVKEACLLLAEEYFKLKDAPFGVVNWGEFGPVRVTINRRAIGLLKHYARGKVKVG